MEDEALVAAYLQGDTEAFNTLAERHQERIYRLAFRLLGNRDDAQDAVQEVLLRLLKSLPRYRAVAKFSTWLYRLAANTCIDLHRRRSGGAVLEPLDEDRPAPEAAADPETQCEAGFRELVLNLALQALPEPQRLVLVLRDREELSNPEAADILGIDVGTLKSRLHRARGALRRVLQSGVCVPGYEQLGPVHITAAGAVE